MQPMPHFVVLSAWSESRKLSTESPSVIKREGFDDLRRRFAFMSLSLVWSNTLEVEL